MPVAAVAVVGDTGCPTAGVGTSADCEPEAAAAAAATGVGVRDAGGVGKLSEAIWSEEAGVRILRGEGLCQLGAGKAARAEIKIAIVI